MRQSKTAIGCRGSERLGGKIVATLSADLRMCKAAIIVSPASNAHNSSWCMGIGQADL
jgi:hypothetical protein